MLLTGYSLVYLMTFLVVHIAYSVKSYNKYEYWIGKDT